MEKEARDVKEVTSHTNILKSPVEAVMPSSTVDDFSQFQDLMKRVVDTLQIPLEEVHDFHNKFLDIVHTSASTRQTLLEPAKMIWKTPTMHHLPSNVSSTMSYPRIWHFYLHIQH